MFLVVLLYMIGKNQHLFGSTFLVRARFENVQGLVGGNNVRYAGIHAGTVKSITILSDTSIEVVMLIDQEMKQFIRSNAIASIGTDGLIGNKVINIAPSREAAPLVREGDILYGRKTADANEMLRTLDNTTNDVAVIAANLKITVMRINSSSALWQLLNDNSLPKNIRASAANIQVATARAAKITDDLQVMISDVRNGKGSLGSIIRDSSFTVSLSEAMAKINQVGLHVDKLVGSVDTAITELRLDIGNGKGPANALLKDSAMAAKLGNSLANIEKGTDAFNQNMEALKHSFLFRGYFRKLEKAGKTTK